MSTRNYSSRMRECREAMFNKAIFLAILLSALSGCSQIPIRDGGLAVGKDTTASIEDLGVASLSSKF